MNSLHDILSNPNSIETATIMFVDMTNSTETTATTPESSWIANFGRAFDAIAEVVAEGGGELVKFLGDGVMAKFDGERPVNAINAGIRIQETIKDLGKHEINCVSSIGIATGRVRRFDAVNGAPDYLGTTVNRAARLCAAAGSQAIIIDGGTFDGANIMSIRSVFGKASEREGRAYLSDEIATSLKGIKETTICYEVRWDKDTFGISGSHHSEAVKNTAPAEVPIEVDPGSGAASGSEEFGTISLVNEEKNFVFIDGTGGQSYFSQPGYFIDGAQPRVGARVFFHKRPPIVEGKSPIASPVIIVGEPYEARVTRILDQFCFFELIGSHGENHQVFHWLGDRRPSFAEGDLVEFDLRGRYVKKEARFKATADNVQMIEDDESRMAPAQVGRKHM